MRHVRISAVLSVLALSLAFGVAQQTTVDDAIRRFAQAEAFYAEGSYARARTAYVAVDVTGLSEVERRWVEFRTADSGWRAEAGNPRQDDPVIVAARVRLEKLIAESDEDEPHDRIWAEAQESLGDLKARIQYGSSQHHHLAALEWWAGSSDIDFARKRYLAIVWKMSTSFWSSGYSMYPRHELPPRAVLENALKIAVTPGDRARAAYLLARSLEHDGDERSRDRIEDAFEIAIASGRSADWYDDALFSYAQWLERAGRTVELPNGQWQISSDFEKALAIYRRLISEFREGQTPHLRQARARVTEITAPSVAVSVPGVFVPGSEIELAIRSRNVDAVTFTILPVDLTRDILPSDTIGNWMQRLDAASAKPVLTWTKSIPKKTDAHDPHAESFRLEQELGPGAYVVLAKAGEVTAKELILVSETTVVLRSSPTETIVYVADAMTGAPVAGAKVRLLDETWSPSRNVETHDAVSDANGLARIRTARAGNSQMLALASKGDRQAFAQSSRYGRQPQGGEWRIYALTDRPAYRPGETVHWKITARQLVESGYTNPAGRSLRYEILDPRGAKVAGGNGTLNAFGSFWSDLELTAAMPLGLYSVTFTDDAAKRSVGRATLFRLEEYKLPEFTVSVETPMEDGRQKVFRLGDRVTATVRAEYYFGGGVPNATVEVIVTEQPQYRTWRPQRELPWFHEEVPQRHFYGRGEVVKQEVVRTDATGSATIEFDTPRGAQNDLQYVIEARVTDASRREVAGSGTVRVGRQTYSVYATPEHHLHRPGAKATIDFHAQDANGQPVAVTGTVRVIRQRTIEIWRSPDGKRVAGDELERERTRFERFPPPSRDGRGWTLERRTTEELEVLTHTVTTDAEGNGSYTFTPDRDGYYRILWSSDDRRDPSRPRTPADVVRAETAI
ncbi:MAG: MG2 domain-containing protein, partial [Thermoanaerobaculia bacterium]